MWLKMTIPYERYRAVLQTQKFLYELVDPKQTPKIPSAIRERARSCLKHYPNTWDMDKAGEACPEVFEASNPFQQYCKESLNK